MVHHNIETEAERYIREAQQELKARKSNHRNPPPRQSYRGQNWQGRRPVKGKRKRNQPAAYKPPLFERFAPGLSSVIEGLAFLVFAFVAILGVASVSMVDVAFGSVALGAIFQNPIPLFGGKTLSPLAMGALISLATSGVQSVLWTMVTQRVNSKSDEKPHQIITLRAGFAFALILVVADTMIDVSVLSWAVYGISPLEHTFLGHGLIFSAAQLILGLITSCSELLVAFLIMITREFGRTSRR